MGESREALLSDGFGRAVTLESKNVISFIMRKDTADDKKTPSFVKNQL